MSASNPKPRPDEPTPEPAPTPGGPGSQHAVLRLVEEREHSLLSLFELSHELSVSLDVYGLADLALLNLMGHFGTPRAALWVFPEDTPREAVLIRGRGTTAEVARALAAALAPPFVERYTYEMEPVVLATWGVEGAGLGATLAVAQGFSVLAPVAAHGRLIGMLALGERARPHDYGALELKYVATAAGMVGVALANTRLYHGMLESNRQLRDANERMTELDRLKSEFLQGVNHELRTPLAIVIGYASCLVDGVDLEPRHREALDVILEQSQKLNAMVQGLLDFSAADSGALDVRIEVGDVRPLLEAFAETRRPGIVEGLREFQLDLEQHLPLARFDPRRLTQILDALIDNAVKFTPRGSLLRLSADRVREDGASWVRIGVQDDGPGIPAQHLAGLFEPLHQLDGSTTRTAGGMGMGLALVQRLAEKMGGRLAVTSQVGVGSTFRVRLPAV
jgi:signal transduction histidine kinase